MALLTNPFFQIGAGLLARSGPSLQPINPYGGINDGLMAVQAARQDEQRALVLQMQQEDMARKMARQKGIDAYSMTLTDPTARAFPEIAAQQALQAQYAQRDTKGVKVVPGDEYGMPGMMVEVETLNGAPVNVTPIPPPTDGRTSAQKDYEAAKNDPAFEAYQNRMRQAGAIKLDMGGTDRITPQEAKLMRYEDGSPVAPGTLWEEARAKGVTVATRADEKVEEIDAKEAVAQERAVGPLGDYASSVESWRADPQNVEKWATIEQERRRLAQMLASVRNPGRAPTDADVNLALQDVPSPVSGLGGIAAVTGGGDPFTARLKVLAKELGGTLPGQPPKVTNKEQYDALPSGTEYMEDDGQLYRKP